MVSVFWSSLKMIMRTTSNDDGNLSSSEDDVRCVTFDNNEDDRIMEIDDGFGWPYAFSLIGTNRDIPEGKSDWGKSIANKISNLKNSNT